MDLSLKELKNHLNSIDKYKVHELKEILRTLGLKTSGLKVELQSTLKKKLVQLIFEETQTINQSNNNPDTQNTSTESDDISFIEGFNDEFKHSSDLLSFLISLGEFYQLECCEYIPEDIQDTKNRGITLSNQQFLIDVTITLDTDTATSITLNGIQFENEDFTRELLFILNHDRNEFTSKLHTTLTDQKLTFDSSINDPPTKIQNETPIKNHAEISPIQNYNLFENETPIQKHNSFQKSFETISPVQTFQTPIQNHESIYPIETPIQNHDSIYPMETPIQNHESIYPMETPIQNHESIYPMETPIQKHNSFEKSFETISPIQTSHNPIKDHESISSEAQIQTCNSFQYPSEKISPTPIQNYGKISNQKISPTSIQIRKSSNEKISPNTIHQQPKSSFTVQDLEDEEIALVTPLKAHSNPIVSKIKPVLRPINTEKKKFNKNQKNDKQQTKAKIWNRQYQKEIKNQKSPYPKIFCFIILGSILAFTGSFFFEENLTVYWSGVGIFFATLIFLSLSCYIFFKNRPLKQKKRNLKELEDAIQDLKNWIEKYHQSFPREVKKKQQLLEQLEMELESRRNEILIEEALNILK